MKTIRWQRIASIVIPFTIAATFPYWYRLIHPEFFEVRCITQTPSGEIVKAAGQDCDEGTSPSSQ
jgi:hypothetical protein